MHDFLKIERGMVVVLHPMSSFFESNTVPLLIHKNVGSDYKKAQEVLLLLWLWSWPAATALIRPLGWEPPYAVGVALKRPQKKKKKKKRRSSEEPTKAPNLSRF